MQVTKLRVRSETNGLVPMGQYFARIATQLEAANAIEPTRQAKLDAEDARLEARSSAPGFRVLRYAKPRNDEGVQQV